MLIHIVRPGETVYGIARQYGISASRILIDNGLSAPSRLVVGQALIITLPKIVYIVRRGDTLDSIAAAYGTTAIVLIQNNPELVENPILRVGQELTIRFRGEKTRTIRISGYAYPYINRDTLLRALPFLTYLSIFSYGFRENGDLIPVDDSELIRLAYQYQAEPIMVLTTITEGGSFSTEKAKRLLNDKDYQNRVLDHILAVMKEKGYAGLDVDFEFIAPEDAQAYLNFLSNAKARLSAAGLLLSVALAPKTFANQPGLLYEAHNYPATGGIADMVFLMTYEWGYTYGPPMAVAPLPQVKAVTRYAVSVIPPEKILLGIPNYGYNWRLPFEQGISQAMSIGNEQAIRIASRNNAGIEYDETVQSPFFRYMSEGTEHVVWFEDVRSIEAKFDLVDETGLSGAGYWNIMRPFSQNWALISTRYNVQKNV
ncbi:MAG TPA: glycosyl hydrolase family 18 protein [Oscillospiraceae bacterium]|mgnify:CR=1 FL=1|nr:glycosyl hydrolase family 18 protein [Oscillospiraceae bacterium]HRW56260.1 glycosyl hydrolase family 18 protein [Oscillospiraceae bacterium]